MSDVQALVELEADIEVEIAAKIPTAVEVVKEMLAEKPDLTVGELASAFMFSLNQSHLAWYTAYLFMEKAKSAVETIKEA